MKLQTILNALGAIGPVLSAIEEVQEVFETAGRALATDDQNELKALLVELRHDRIAAHARLQAKLAAAALL